MCEALDELPLEDEKESEQRRNHEQGRRRDITPLGACLVGHGEYRQAEGQGSFFDGVDHNQGPEKIVPLIR